MWMHGTQQKLNIRKKENDYKQNDILYSLCSIMEMMATVLLTFYTML